jgi:uncharacterized protein (TIRG00374 family)
MYFKEEKPFSEIISFRSILGFLVSGLLLFITLKKSGLQLEHVSLNKISIIFFFLAEISFVFSIFAYSFRAQLIWSNKKAHVEVPKIFASIVIGNFYNILLPGNLGDAVRAWHFSQKNRITFMKSIASIVTEKWVDAQMFVFLVAVLFSVKPFLPHFVSYSILIVAGIAFCSTMLYIFLRKCRWIEKRVWILILLLKKPGRWLFKIYYYTNEHLANLKNRNLYSAYFLMCVCILLMNMLQFYFLMCSANLPGMLCTVYSSFFISLSMMIIAFIPSAPSSIGVMHFGLYSTLILIAKIYDFPTNTTTLQSFALFGIYVHLSYVLPDLLIGVIYVWRERKTLFDKK